MKNYLKIVLLAAVVSVIGLGFHFNQVRQDNDTTARLAVQKAADLEQKLNAERLLEEQHVALVQFTLKAMEMKPATKISSAKQKIIAEKCAADTIKYIHIVEAEGNNDRLTLVQREQNAREQYISMVKIESNFDNSSKSPVGAVGIGQIMPGTFASTIKSFDIGAKQEDIYNEDVNLAIGAIYFNQLLAEQDNNPRFASIAYNGGSKTADKFKTLADINQESANYALKTEHVKETVNKTNNK